MYVHIHTNLEGKVGGDVHIHIHTHMYVYIYMYEYLYETRMHTHLEGKVGGDVPRGDAIDADLIFCPLTRQVLCEHVHGCLCCCVDGACR